MLPTKEEEVIGMVRDITEAKLAQAEVAARRRELTTFFNVAIDLLCITDMEGNIHRVNQAWSDVLGYSVSELEQMNILEFIHPEDQESTRDALAVIKQQQPVFNFVNRYRCKDGSYRSIEWRARPEGKLIYAGARDITEKIQAERKLKHLTFHDSLTGLYNRRFMEQELRRLDNNQQLPVSILMADVNGLKIVNDSLGHLEGDKLLTKVTRVITTACRQQDLVARWGGDEFVIVLPNTSEDQAERIRASILRLSDEAEEKPIKLSISLGSSTKTRPEQDLMQVLKEAEDDMYRHKSANSQSSRSALVTSLQRTLQEKSYETQQHARNLQELAVAIGHKLHLAEREINELSLLAILHDLGKVAIPEAILTKPGALTDEEWETMRKHPDIGYRIALASPDLVSVAEGIRSHHERWDGNGYPRGLAGKQIPLISRIIAIVDSFDAMTSNRHYREAIDEQSAIEEIKRCAGTQFDPELVEVFLEVMDKASVAG